MNDKRQRKKLYRQEHAQQIKQAAKRYRENNKDKIRTYDRRYREKHRDVVLLLNRNRNTDSDLNVRAPQYANKLLVRVRRSFQQHFTIALHMPKQYEINVWKRVIKRSHCR